MYQQILYNMKKEKPVDGNNPALRVKDPIYSCINNNVVFYASSPFFRMLTDPPSR